MGSDGAHQGVTAGRALETILGDKPTPDDSEKLKLTELEARIRSRSHRGTILIDDGQYVFHLFERQAQFNPVAELFRKAAPS